MEGNTKSLWNEDPYTLAEGKKTTTTTVVDSEGTKMTTTTAVDSEGTKRRRQQL